MTLFFSLATAVFTWPLVTHLGDTLPDWADPADSVWRIGVIAQQLRTDPLHLYQTAAFYPIANGLALDELLTGQGLLAAPIIWATGNPVLAFNVLVWVSYALSGLAMWLLVRDLTGSDGAGLVAGLIFAFSPWHMGQYGHLGLGAQQWMIFALVCLRRFLRASAAASRLRTPRMLGYLGLFGLFAVLQALVAGYYAYFEAILFGLYLLYYFGWASGVASWFWRWLRRAARPPIPHWQRIAQQLGLLAGVSLLGAAVILPFVWPFVQAQRTFGFARSLTEAAYWSAAPTSLLRTNPQSWLYPWQVRLFGLETSSERALYPGLVAVVLAVIGLLGWWRHPSLPRPFLEKTGGTDFPLPRGERAGVRGGSPLPRAAGIPGEHVVFALLSLVGLVLSFGPALYLDIYRQGATGLPLPYAWLYQYVPGFDALRVPTRFGQLFMLGLAVCAGYGILDFRFWILESAKSKAKIQNLKSKIILVLILLLIVADYGTTGWPTMPTPAGEAAPPVYRWLAAPEQTAMVPRDALLLEWPMSASDQPFNTNPIYLLYGLLHGRPLLNGSANIIPPGYDRLFYEMRRFPSAGTLDLAEGLGVQDLIVHTQSLTADKRTVLDQLAGAGGRLEALASFPDSPLAPDASVTVYHLHPAPARFAPLAAAIPPGVDVLLTDQPGHRRLTTTVLPRLLGANYHYFITYYTVYNPIMPNLQLAQPGRVYPYAIFYADADSAAEPAKYGYSAADRVAVVLDGLLAIYHKTGK